MAMNQPIETPDNPFWNFSLQFYGQKGVSDLLLWFQDEWHADINLILYCCWAGVFQKNGLTEVDINFLRRAVDRWQSEIVQPLRSLRQTLTTDARGAPAALVAGLLASLKQAELKAERLQQDMLYSSVPRETHGSPDEGGARQHASSNMVLYLTQVRGPLNTVGMAKITALVDALFDPDFRNH